MRGDWQTVRVAGFRWRVRARAREELERTLLSRLPDPGESVRVGRTRRGRSFHALASPEGGLFVKRLAPARYDATVVYRIAAGRMRGRREFRNAVRAHRRGAAVPEPLAFGERHRPLRSYESLLVYRRLPDPFRPVGEGSGSTHSGVDPAMLAAFAADLHDHGVFHMDLTPENLLAAPAPNGGARLVAVDLETAVVWSPGSLRLAARSLARIAETADGLAGDELRRFLDLYLSARRRPMPRDALVGALRRLGGELPAR